MNAIQLVKNLSVAGYHLSLDGENIHFKYIGQGSPDKAKVEPLLAELKQHKVEIAELLKAKTEPVSMSEGRKQTLTDVCDVILDKSRDFIVDELKRLGMSYQPDEELNKVADEIDRLKKEVMDGKATIKTFRDACEQWANRTIEIHNK